MTAAAKTMQPMADGASRYAPKTEPKPPDRSYDAPREGRDVPHPLAQFIELSQDVAAPAWVIPGVVAEGVIAVAGQHGIGKTTALVPLSMVAAGLHAPLDPLAPKPGRWRHVIYVTEDTSQVQRILAGIVNFGDLSLRWEDVRDRFHLVPAMRLPIERIVEVADEYRRRFARSVECVELLPLVVIDTKSAVVETDDENANGEASKLVAALKQRFAGCPIWVVTHLAKAAIGRSDVAAMTSRGAGALDADAHGTMFLVQEEDERYIVLGKKRYEPRWNELHVRSRWQQTWARDAWGDQESILLRWGIPEPAEETRADTRERAQEAARSDEATALRTEILDAVDVAWSAGTPMNRAGLRGKVRRKVTDVVAATDLLLAETWLYEVPIPAAIRRNPAQSSFLIRLTEAERQTVLQGQPLPAERVAIPPSWTRSPLVPEVNA